MTGRAAAALVAAALTACAPHPPPPRISGSPAYIEREAVLMGTRARLAAFAASRAEGLPTLDDALRLLEDTEAELSTWRPDSVVSRLNRQPVGVPFQLPRPTCATFDRLYAFQRDTGGAFDPAIGALLAAWDIHGAGRVPAAAALEDARARSGLARLTFDASTCTVTRTADVTVDAGAFGKGDALDRVDAAIPGTWLIDLGGQVTVKGAPPGSRGWQVSIAHPVRRDERLFDVVLREGSLATSAGSERDLTADGTRIGHVLDPRTGRPAPFTGSVVVWRRRGLDADMLSTALFVMGPDAGLRWAAERGLAVCFLVPQPAGDVRIVATPAFDGLRAAPRAGSAASAPE